MKVINQNFFNSLLLIIGLSISMPLNAQVNDFLFSHFKKKKTLTYGFNNRRTSLLYDHSTIYAGYVGIKFGSQLKHVITLNSTAFWVGNPERLAAEGLQPLEVQLNFVGLSEEFMFWKKNRWTFSSYIHLGAGQGRFRSIAPDQQIVDEQWMFPLELGIHSGYSPNSWLELRVGGGYRHLFKAGDWPLHGLYYKVGAGVNFRELKKRYYQLKFLSY